MMWLDGDCNGCAGKKARISRKGAVRNDMESTRMARISRHGMADAGWRGASGSGRDCSGRYGEVGEYWPVLTSTWRVKSRGMEGSGTVGIMEARQEWSDGVSRVTVWAGV